MPCELVYIAAPAVTEVSIESHYFRPTSHLPIWQPRVRVQVLDDGSDDNLDWMGAMAKKTARYLAVFSQNTTLSTSSSMLRLKTLLNTEASDRGSGVAITHHLLCTANAPWFRYLLSADRCTSVCNLSSTSHGYFFPLWHLVQICVASSCMQIGQRAMWCLYCRVLKSLPVC